MGSTFKTPQWGRDKLAETRIKAGLRLNIGWTVKGGFPVRLDGFMICHNDWDDSRKIYKPAYSLMDAVSPGCTADGRLKAAADNCYPASSKSGDGKDWSKIILPREIEFRLDRDAIWDEENAGWEFPNMVAAKYETFGRPLKTPEGEWALDDKGRVKIDMPLTPFCTSASGGGCASRLASNKGDRKEVECIPMGAEGRKPSEWCEYSAGGFCKPEITFSAEAMIRDDRGVLIPLDRTRGSRFIISTSSQPAFFEILGVLKHAANRLRVTTNAGTKSWLNGISGILSVRQELTRRKNDGGGAANVAVRRIAITLNEDEIGERQWRLMKHLEMMAPANSKLLEYQSDAPAAPETKPDDDPIEVYGEEIAGNGHAAPDLMAGTVHERATSEGGYVGQMQDLKMNESPAPDGLFDDDQPPIQSTPVASPAPAAPESIPVNTAPPPLPHAQAAPSAPVTPSKVIDDRAAYDAAIDKMPDATLRIELDSHIKLLAGISERPYVDCLKAMAEKGGRAPESLDTFFKFAGKDEAKHTKAMSYMRDVLRKAIKAVEEIEAKG